MFRCAADVAPLRAGPDPNAEQVTQALRDEPLAVERTVGEWALVRTTYDYGGWVLRDALARGRGALPPARHGDPVDEARAYLGAPYEWGGLTRAGIDCSGLVHVAHRRLGRLVPRDAWQQEAAARRIGADELRRGDLISYGGVAAERATHIAFWLGGGRVLHATARAGVCAVVEEDEPEELASTRRLLLRLPFA